MSSITNATDSQTISLLDRAKQNLEDHKWQILVPGPVGLAALAMTVVFLVSNPFGWAFSAGLVGAGIAFASLNAISGIGYSLYYLLKEPRQIKNLYTDETLSTDRLVATIRDHFKKKEEIEMTPPQQTPSPPTPVELPSPKKRKKKKEIVAQTVTQDPSTPVESKGNPGRITKGTLALGSLLLAGYGVYAYYSTLSAAAATAYNTLSKLPFFPSPRTLFYYVVVPPIISKLADAMAGPPEPPPEDSSLPENGTQGL